MNTVLFDPVRDAIAQNNNSDNPQGSNNSGGGDPQPGGGDPNPGDGGTI